MKLIPCPLNGWRNADEFAYGMPPLGTNLMRATPGLAALVVLTLLATLVAWLRGYWRVSGRLHYTCVLLAGGAILWFLYHWNLFQWPV